MVSAMDIFQLLRHDHVEALEALAEWVRRPGGRRGAGAWARFKERWEVHVRVEENFLFPLLKGEPELRRLIEEAVASHARIRKCAHDMPSPDGDARAWTEAVSDLMETLEALLGMEERRLIPRARGFLPEEDAEELAAEVEDFLRGLQAALAAD
jgi:hypothetical protein